MVETVKSLNAQHWLAIGLVLTGLAGPIGAMHDWSEAVKPAFIAGALTQIGGVVVAVFSPRPKKVGDPPTDS